MSSGTGQAEVSRAWPLESTSQEAWSNGLNVNGDFGAAGAVGVREASGVGAGAAVRCEPGVMLPSHWVSPVSSPGR